jgi:small-conductance mechanosensitive channel
MSSSGWNATRVTTNGPSNEIFLAGASRRIALLALLIGLSASVVVFLAVSRRAGAGVAVGTALAWLGFRWLEQFADAIAAAASEQREGAAARVPTGVYIRMAVRYMLIALAIWVILRFFNLPIVSILVGLLSVGAGAMAEGIFELIKES